MFWLPVLVFVPSTVLAVCKIPIVRDVRLDASTYNVTWQASYEPDCLKGFQVCWTSMRDKDVSCDMAPPDATSLQIRDDGMEPCERFNVEVTALSRNLRFKDSRYAYGMAGPPRITGLTLTQGSRDLATLEWAPVSNHSCVSSVELWLCDNSTQDLATCMYTKMGSATVKFELNNFEVCRNYYAVIRASGGAKPSPPTTMEMYLDSASEVTKVEVSNVTHDSAVVSWWVSDEKLKCQAEKMTLCLQEEGDHVLPECWEWTLDQDNPRDFISLSDLRPCEGYVVSVSLTTAGRHSQKTVTFTTPMAVKALKAAAESVGNTAAVVKWSYDAASTDCEPSVVQVCYARRDDDGDGGSRMCRTLGTATRSSVRLSDLQPCSAYTVALTLLTSVGPRPNCSFPLVTSSKGLPVIKSMNVTADGSNLTARWAAAESSLQCVSHYNVSWSTTPGGRLHGWKRVDAGDKSFTFTRASRRASYRVQVAAVLADGTAQALSGDVAASG